MMATASEVSHGKLPSTFGCLCSTAKFGPFLEFGNLAEVFGGFSSVDAAAWPLLPWTMFSKVLFVSCSTLDDCGITTTLCKRTRICD